MRRFAGAIATAGFLSLATWMPAVGAIESRCFGTVANGRLEGGVRLPLTGPNFSAYSEVGARLGRTYVHSLVRDVVVDAYRALEAEAPGKVFVYGEGSWREGGRLRPHRTHQNGLSVDFMVPVIDGAGRSVPLPSTPLNKFGYDIEFDRNARFENLSIDFEALAEHLHQLWRSAQSRNVGIARVILDPPYLAKLFATRRGAELKDRLPFMTKPAWIRHDEHYHVDFKVACGPLS